MRIRRPRGDQWVLVVAGVLYLAAAFCFTIALLLELGLIGSPASP